MKNTVSFGGLTAALPKGWLDVTDDLPGGSPITLAKPDGVGALQFSAARYKSGTMPNVGMADLKSLLTGFAESKGLGTPLRENEGNGTHPYVAGDFELQGETIRVWYLSNGRDVVLVTYVAQESNTSQVSSELEDATQIIETLDFK